MLRATGTAEGGEEESCFAITVCMQIGNALSRLELLCQRRRLQISGRSPLTLDDSRELDSLKVNGLKILIPRKRMAIWVELFSTSPRPFEVESLSELGERDLRVANLQISRKSITKSEIGTWVIGSRLIFKVGDVVSKMLN